MKQSREKVRIALLWIKKYYPAFENIRIILERLELILGDGLMTPTIFTITEEEETVIDVGPAPGQIFENDTDGTVPQQRTFRHRASYCATTLESIY